MTFGATILDPEGPRLTSDEKRFFRDANPFGFILFARSLETPDQIRALCAELREAVGRDAPITIDQEGGRVQRLRPPLGRDWLPALDHVTQSGEQAERAMYLRSRLMAHELRDLGIDSNCAPLVDVARAETHPFLYNRCYGTDPAAVARIGRAMAEGLLAGGVLPVVKHIPGHGRAQQDSHEALPHVSAEAGQLAQSDFAPFKALNDLPMGMTAHLVFDAIDARPATLSSTVMGLIRAQIGFQGLIMTDDLGMKALQGDLAALAREALAAGCDVILYCNGDLSQRRQVAEAAGDMTSAAQARAEAALNARRTPDDIDIEALEAELERLMQGRVYVG